MSTIADRSALKGRIKSRAQSDPDFDSTYLKARTELLEIEGRRRVFDLRDNWSTWIIVWISWFIVFHTALTVAVGLGYLDFTQAKWLVPLIVVENFLQIVGMGYIVVRFLYPGAGKSP